MALLEISGSAPFTGYSQSVGWDHTHFKGSLRENLLSSSFTWLLAGLKSLLALHWDISSLPHGPFHRAAHNSAVSFPQSAWLNEQEQEYPRRKTLSLYYLILELTFHHFCHFLFISRASPYPKGGNSTQIQISGGRKSLESILENTHHILWSNLTCRKTHGFKGQSLRLKVASGLYTLLAARIWANLQFLFWG